MAKNRDFNVFNNSELIVGFLIEGGIVLPEKILINIQIGSKTSNWSWWIGIQGIQEDGTYKSSVKIWSI